MGLLFTHYTFVGGLQCISWSIPLLPFFSTTPAAPFYLLTGEVLCDLFSIPEDSPFCTCTFIPSDHLYVDCRWDVGYIHYIDSGLLEAIHTML
jgi:hypothetical protein